MADAQYMRDVAKRCDAISRNCFDLRAAELMRLLADEIRGKAAEQPSIVRLPILKGRALADQELG
jgi:hypothetical protein